MTSLLQLTLIGIILGLSWTLLIVWYRGYRARNEAERLWGILDDISTAGDYYKPAICPYSSYVMKTCESRIGLITSDGHTLKWYWDRSE